MKQACKFLSIVLLALLISSSEGMLNRANAKGFTQIDPLSFCLKEGDCEGIIYEPKELLEKLSEKNGKHLVCEMNRPFMPSLKNQLKLYLHDNHIFSVSIQNYSLLLEKLGVSWETDFVALEINNKKFKLDRATLFLEEADTSSIVREEYQCQVVLQTEFLSDFIEFIAASKSKNKI